MIDTVVVVIKRADGKVRYKAIRYEDIDRIDLAKRHRVELIGYKGVNLGDKPRNVDAIRAKNRTKNHYYRKQQALADRAQRRAALRALRQNPKGNTLDSFQAAE